MPLLQSTHESPLLFLHHYIQHDGTTFLRQRFVSYRASNYYYSEEQDVIIAQGILPRNDKRGELLDEETNTREYTITFKEYVIEEFQKQLTISKKLIREQSKSNTDGQDLKLYKRTLIDCLDAQKWVDSQRDLKFKKEIESLIRGILTYVHRKFYKYYSTIPEYKAVKDYYDNKRVGNITGFKLKTQVRNARIKDIFELMLGNFISRKTNRKSFEQFLLEGAKPQSPIDWNRERNELWYFITKLCSEEILQNRPKQRWKNLDGVFTQNGTKLESNWYRNNNKLQNLEKIEEIDSLVRLFQPKKS